MSHRKVWEDHHGRKRKTSWHIHHINGDHTNNDPTNLFHCSPRRHARLHREMGQPWAANLIMKHSADVSGENNSMYGKKHSAETIAKMTGRKHSAETRAKIGTASALRKHSDEARAKMSDNHTDVSGENNPMFGKPSPMSNPKWQRTCPHCEKTMAKHMFSRYHGDKCKFNNIGVKSC